MSSDDYRNDFEERIRRRNERLQNETGQDPSQPSSRSGRVGVGGFLKTALAVVGYFGVLSLVAVIVVPLVFNEERRASLLSGFADVTRDQRDAGEGFFAKIKAVTDEFADAQEGAEKISSGYQRTLEVLRDPYNQIPGRTPKRTVEVEITPGVVKSRTGAVYDDRVALHAGSGPADARNILPPDAFAKAPSVKTIATFEANGECVFRPVGANERLAGVRLGYGGGPVVAHAFSDEALVKRLDELIGVVREQGVASRRFKRLRGDVRVVDVYVTDRSAPQYLVLQSVGGVAWRIHAAQGVTIAHVALVGGAATALMEPLDGVSYEAVLSRDFIKFFGNGLRPKPPKAKPENCTVHPFRIADQTWAAFDGANRGVSVDRNLLNQVAVGQTAYDTWYRSVFGVGVKRNTAAAASAAHVLIGPKPVKGEQFQTGATEKLVIVRKDHIVTGDAEAREAGMYALHEGLIAQAAGGDIANLSPPIVRR